MKYAMRAFLGKCATIASGILFVAACGLTILALLAAVIESPLWLLALIALIPAVAGSHSLTAYCSDGC